MLRNAGSWPVRVAAALVAAAVVVLGVWVAGGLVTDDAGTAKAATAVWFGLATAAAAAVGWRWRPLAVPVLAATVLTAGVVGGALLWTSTVDTVVVEDVEVAAAAPATPTATGTPRATATAGELARPVPPPAGPVLLARGAFRSGEHATTGTAALLRRADGSAVVTLTDLDTSPGPDLRVRLSVRGGTVDAGALRGNRGTQQYAVPPGTDLDRVTAVVIWCRAFSVAFGTAPLRA